MLTCGRPGMRRASTSSPEAGSSPNARAVGPNEGRDTPGSPPNSQHQRVCSGRAYGGNPGLVHGRRWVWVGSPHEQCRWCCGWHIAVWGLHARGCPGHAIALHRRRVLSWSAATNGRVSGGSVCCAGPHPGAGSRQRRQDDHPLYAPSPLPSSALSPPLTPRCVESGVSVCRLLAGPRNEETLHLLRTGRVASPDAPTRLAAPHTAQQLSSPAENGALPNTRSQPRDASRGMS